MRSNHEGHDVYFYHSQAGGCCDCGDFGAWCSDGFCDRHGHMHVADPLATVDPVLRTCGLRLLSSLMEELSAFAEDYAKSYDLNVLQRLHEQQEEQEEREEQEQEQEQKEKEEQEEQKEVEQEEQEQEQEDDDDDEGPE